MKNGKSEVTGSEGEGCEKRDRVHLMEFGFVP